MVDRIVPATTGADVAEAARLLGLDDAVPVVAEPYTEWVLEDRFVAARPAWEDAGARIVTDVAPFETMKLRLLNGSHSTLAYLGFLAGHEFIWQASADPPFATLIDAFDDGGDRADARGAGGRRPAGVLPATARTVPQSGASAPDAADRDGRLAEAATATARDGA